MDLSRRPAIMYERPGTTHSHRPVGVTDAHLHVLPWDRLRPDLQALLRHDRPDADLFEAVGREPARLLEEMDRLGIRRAVLMGYVSPMLGLGEDLVEWLLDYALASPERILVFGSPPLKRASKIPARLASLKERGMRGIKIHPPHLGIAPNAYLSAADHPLRALYAAAGRLRLPVVIHTGISSFPGARSRMGDPMLVDDVAVDFPELRILLAHGGRPLWADAAFFLVRRHPNVWLDLSGIPPHRIRPSFPRLEAIGEKVLYGSDWPGPGVPSLERCLQDFWRLDLPEELKLRILVENPSAFLG